MTPDRIRRLAYNATMLGAILAPFVALLSFFLFLAYLGLLPTL